MEGNVDGTVGGSYYVLYDLVVNLDRGKYCPVVVFYFDNFLVTELRDRGIETYVCERAQPVILPFKTATAPWKVTLPDHATDAAAYQHLQTPDYPGLAVASLS